MDGSLLLLALPVLLQSVLTNAAIDCFSDYSKDGTGIQKNGHCQIKYNLNESSGCPLMVNPPILTAPGRRPAQKSFGGPSVTLDSCRFDGPSIVCNCDTPYCNKNFYKLWPSVLDVLQDVSEECRKVMTTHNYDIMDPLKNTINPITNTTFKPVKVAPTIECGVTGSETTVKGHQCAVDVVLMEGTCFIRGEPTFSAVTNVEDQICINPNTVRIVCDTNNCNTDKEIIKQQIENRTGITGGNLKPNCQKDLLLSFDQLPGFGVPVVQTPTEAPNPCGPGGVVGKNGTCECKTGWVDIMTMKDLPEGHNHTEGKLCVTENACVLQGDQHVIMFILDASSATHTNDSFAGMKGFVLNVENLIDKSSNNIVFVAYGGTSTKTGTLNFGWTSQEFKDEVNRVLDGYIGRDTNIADGFDKAKEVIGTHDRTVKRVVIHIGDGKPTGIRSQESQPSYDQLSAVVDRFIAVSVASVGEHMINDWHTPGDYVDFTTGGYEDLNLDKMKFLMQKVCPQQPYEEIIKNSLRLNKE